MIIVEDILEEIVNQIPAIKLNPDLSAKPKFGHGDLKELNKWLQAALDDNNKDIYPLVWLFIEDNDYDLSGQVVEREVKIIIAVRESDKTLLNKDRFKKSFKFVLNPMAQFIIEGLKTSTATTVTSDKISVGRFTDLSDAEKGEVSQTIDKWDAVKITADVEFTNNCLNKITWLTKQ